ncbi:unnamed protein product [Pleuronectes platessa]|uniref:Uncharacterized protein n=1 Tax=Pleuronectes platessa TaxID=8262 RepID=A0A9N7YCQ1_PLEPL|nr:unnamed protein product [Pleuronectes platessa]
MCFSAGYRYCRQELEENFAEVQVSVWSVQISHQEPFHSLSKACAEVLESPMWAVCHTWFPWFKNTRNTT